MISKVSHVSMGHKSHLLEILGADEADLDTNRCQLQCSPHKFAEPQRPASELNASGQGAKVPLILV